MGIKMAEPASSAAGGLIGWKLIGGVAGALSLGAALAAIIVMLMTPPRHAREWAVGLISTVVSSIGGAAVAVQYLGIESWVHSGVGLVAMFGLVFACGLPGWALVRAVFTYLAKQDGKGIDEVIKDAKDVVTR